ncbi:MAG: helix-turn-helix domain-containing protein [Pseudomonadota bacterium]
MDNTAEEPFVPPSALSALRARAVGAGLSVDRMAGDLGLDLNGWEHTGRLPLAHFLRLQTRLTTLVDDETGRRSKRPLLTGSTELALSRLPSRGSLVHAMDTVARSYNLLHGGSFNSVEDRVDVVGFFIDDSTFPYAVSDDEEILFTMETTLLFVHALLRLIVPSVAAGGWRGVELKRPESPSRVPFETHVETRYGQRRYALLYDRGSAQRVVTFPAPGAITLEAVTEEQIRLLNGGPDDRTFAGRVRLLIEEGAGDQTAVADALGMSVATLRRRLVDEGASFRGLRTETLRAKAEGLLRTDMPLVHVAERLGFSDVRSFSRAFKTWTGLTPNTMRRSARG